ncbi:hypothetical protein EGK_09815, partial [Macaca mulatta]
DYICPRCESGFIEELPEETRSTENGSAPSTAPTDQSRPPLEHVDQIIQQLVNGIITPATIPSLGPWGVLHSNPMDYAWGANGLDAIITQLLNQFENTGPPPADKEKIQALPTVPVTEEHVHDSCPVCRKSLTGQNTATNPPGLTGVSFSSSSSSSSSSSPSNENATGNS